jgi:predicted transcriptional regulator
MIASEGNVHVRENGRLGEISIAIKEKERRDFIRSLLQNLGISPNKDKTIEGQESVMIHGFSNFKIMKERDLVSLHPKKQRNLEIGILGFRQEQHRKGQGQLIILEELIKGPATSSHLAKIMNKTPSMARVHLRKFLEKDLIHIIEIKGRTEVFEITEKGKNIVLSKNPIESLRNYNYSSSFVCFSTSSSRPSFSTNSL